MASHQQKLKRIRRETTSSPLWEIYPASIQYPAERNSASANRSTQPLSATHEELRGKSLFQRELTPTHLSTSLKYKLPKVLCLVQPPNQRPTRPSSSIHLTFTSQGIICLTTPVKNLTLRLSICLSQMKPLLKCYSNQQIRLLNRRGESPTNLRLTFNSSLKQCQRVSCRALTVLRHRIPLTTFSREKLTGLSRKPRK